MVRNRPRTSVTKGCSGTKVQEAREIIQRQESKRQVAESLGTPEFTLRLRLQRGYPDTFFGSV
jgi:hypothetical protein